MSNFATKSDLKNERGAATSDFGKMIELADLKFDVDKLDIDELKNLPGNLSNLRGKVDKLDIKKLETTPADLINLSNIVKNDIVKKTENYILVKKANNINSTNTSNLVKKTGYNTKFLKLKRGLLIMILINIVLLNNLIRQRQPILQQD